MSDSNIYRPYSRLVRVRILGRWCQVPENNILLRCFQYVAPGIPYGPFCWNGDCDNDRLQCASSEGATPRSALACQTMVKDGLVIDTLSADLRCIVEPMLAAPGDETEAAHALEAESAAASPK
jgi:hypothetical protein